MILDLTKPEHSYFYGFALTDGSLNDYSRNRGSLSIEISIKDKDILYSMKELFSVNSSYKERFRKTNFTNGKLYGYCSLSIYDLDFRNELKSYGFPSGKKSLIVREPNVPFSEIDFVRGLIDGDGSVGFTKANIPFISFTTKSDALRNYYVSFVQKQIGIILNPSKNKRDSIYNIMMNSSSAQKLYKILYYPDCLCLKRKKVDDILLWESHERPHTFLPKRWTQEEDEYILSHSLEESMRKLQRSKDSIETRLWKLKNDRK